MFNKKGDIEIDTLVPWLIGLVILTIFVFLYFTLNSKGGGAISYLKNLISFG